MANFVEDRKKSNKVLQFKEAKKVVGFSPTNCRNPWKPNNKQSEHSYYSYFAKDLDQMVGLLAPTKHPLLKHTDIDYFKNMWREKNGALLLF